MAEFHAYFCVLHGGLDGGVLKQKGTPKSISRKPLKKLMDLRMVAPVQGEIAAFSLQDGKRQEAKGFLGHRGMECGELRRCLSSVFFSRINITSVLWG